MHTQTIALQPLGVNVFDDILPNFTVECNFLACDKRGDSDIGRSGVPVRGDHLMSDFNHAIISSMSKNHHNLMATSAHYVNLPQLRRQP